MRFNRRNLSFLMVGFSLGAALGAAWALAAQPGYVAKATGQVGLRFLGKPLENKDVAQARLAGAVRSICQGLGVQALVQDAQPAQPFELRVWARSATVAEAALMRGAESVVSKYQTWHAREVAGQERVRVRLMALGARIEASEPLSPGAFSEEITLNAERINGTRLVLDALAEGVPRLDAEVQVQPAKGPSIVSSAALFACAGLLWALFIVAAPMRSRWAQAKAGVCVALLGAAGLYQARTAPPGYAAQAVLRIAQWDGVTLPATPPVRPKLLGWVAVETGKGNLPNGVRFTLKGVHDPALGLFELKGTGDDPARLMSMLSQTSEFMRAWHDAGVRGQQGKFGRQLRTAQQALRQRAHAARDPQVHRQASDLILKVAGLERVLSPLRSGPSQILQSPIVHQPDHEERTAPYLIVGMICGMVLAVMGRRWL